MAARAAAKKKNSTLKPWDAYAQEADKGSVDIPLPNGVKTVPFPTGDQLEAFNLCFYQGKLPEALNHLIGDEAGTELLAEAAKAPAGTLGLVLNDLLVEWGLATAPNSGTSSS